MNGTCCPSCSNGQLNQEEEIIKYNSIHGSKYSYEKTKVKGARDEIIVTCPIHGDFHTTPNAHKNGNGCPYCAKEHLGDNTRATWDEFKKRSIEIFGGKYIYKDQEYKNNKTNVFVTCPIHGDFPVRPDHHLEGKGCPICNESKIEREIRIFLSSKNIVFEYRKKNFDWLNGMELDFYLPEYNIAIECQGKQHFEKVDFFNKREAFKHRQELDVLKKELCEKNGIKLLYYSNLGIEYPYYVFEDKNLLLKNILNKK